MTSIALFHQAPLLELRTAQGAVYLAPSRLQRMRLQWTFRHFRVLPPQLLSRHDQRLIEKLSHSAVVTPSTPVSSESILGVVEADFHSKVAAPEDGWLEREDRAALWGILGAMAAAAAGITVLLFSVHALVHRKPVVQTAPAIAVKAPLATEVPLVAAAPAAPVVTPSVTATATAKVAAQNSIPVTSAPKSAAALSAKAAVALAPKPVAAAAVEPLTIKPAPVAAKAIVEPTPLIASDRRWVTELPQGHYAHPVVRGSSPAGEVLLNALVAADGSVQQVSVVSGDPVLAEAGARAVKQWHYRPYEVQGSPVQVATRIKMNFFGPDAVSIASVPSQP